MQPIEILLVALGSALGGAARYVVSLSLNAVSGFPWGTFCVNVLGSLAIGLLSGWLAHWSGNVGWVRAFAVLGLCGGFTTFSTLSNEMFRMLDGGHWGMAGVYVAGSLIVGLAAVALGYWLSR